jgi:hypothetical protein
MAQGVELFRDEAKRVRLTALLAAERHYAAETPWYHMVYYLGIPSTILSAVAGAAAFSKIEKSEIVAGSISIIVAILTSLMTFLDPTKKAELYHATAKSYEGLYHQSGYFGRVELAKENPDINKCEEALKLLIAKLNELNESSPSIPGRAYRIAEKNIINNRGEVVRDPTDIDIPREVFAPKS